MAQPLSTVPVIDTAIVPLNQVRVADLGAGKARFDAWLQSFSGGYVTLERVKDVSAALPVLGNIIAAVDVCGDIATLVENRHTQRSALEETLDWASLAINLIGILPIPPGTPAARMTLRPALAIVRQEVKKGAKDLATAIVGVIAAHVTATLMGELQPFVEQAKTRLEEILRDCGNEAQKYLHALADALDHLADGKLTDAGANLKKAGHEAAMVSAHSLVHDPRQTLPHLFAAVWEVEKAAIKTELNAVTTVAAAVAPAEAKLAIHQMAAELRAFAPQVKAKLARLSSNDAGSILYMLNLLIRAIQVYKEKKARIAATIKQNQANQARHQHAGDQVEAQHTEAQAQKPGVSECKTCALGQAPVKTPRAIGFALGEESIRHTDFVLPGVLPIEWVRTYRSNFGGHDASGPLGPRWTTPFHPSFEVRPDTLVYHDASGRSLDYPLKPFGTPHEDAIEQCSITRVSETEIRIARGAALTETYERRGERLRLTRLVDRQGSTIELAWTEDGRLTTLRGSAGVNAGFTHDEHGRITRVVLLGDEGQELRELARYHYDEVGDLVAASDENAASWAYTYAHHLLTRYTDRTGRGLNLQWDGTHLDARAVREWADDGTFDTRLQWHDHLRLTFVTDAHGGVTQYYYDADGYPYRIVHPDSTEEWFFRDAAKNVTRRVHPNGKQEHFSWDARSNLISHTARDGRTAYFVYDDHDNLTGLQDPESHRWERLYDAKGNVVEATDPLGRVTQYAYNDAGLPVAITDPKGGTSQLVWREDGQLASHTDCSGKTSSWQYDARGQLVAAQNAVGETTRYEYAAGQLTAVVRPDQTREVFERDAEGRLLVHTDALNRQTSYRYTAAGLPAARVNARGDELQYAWNRLGQLSALRNENGREYRFEYDQAGRLVSETGFDGKTTRYVRTAASGELTHKLEGDVVHAFEYDAMGRLARRRGWPARFDGFGQPVLTPAADVRVDEEAFAFDGLGRLLLAVNADSRVERDYDPVGNLESEHLSMRVGEETQTFVSRHEYDALDVRVATTRPDGRRIDWLTYGSGHVHGVLLDGQAVVDFERDDAHREIARKLGNGLRQATAYDNAGRLAHQLLQGTTGKMAERRYRYDDAGQLLAIQDFRRGAIEYAYDPVGRLTQAHSALGVETFAFDPASNLVEQSEREARGFGRDDGTQQSALLDNLLRDYAGTHYRYDARGNLSDRHTNGERTVFTWDSFNRMVSARDPRMAATYMYDALGRRIAKRSEPLVIERSTDGSGYAEWQRRQLKQLHGYGATLFGWDGDTLAYETSLEHRSTTHYVYESGGFTPLLQATAPACLDSASPRPPAAALPGTVSYYHCDQIGTPQELTDTDGSLAWSAHYQAWGAAKEAISETAQRAGLRNPLRFAGQYFDRETGLHYNRHRYYDNASGRFISKDPISLLGGPNVYQYARNPVQWIDPLGLTGADASGRPLSSTAYSVWARIKLPCNQLSKGRRDHFRYANEQLNGMIQDNPGLGDALGKAVTDHVSPGARGGYSVTSPPGLTWHHSAQDPEYVELIPRAQHQSPGAVQGTLHPNGGGGFKALNPRCPCPCE